MGVGQLGCGGSAESELAQGCNIMLQLLHSSLPGWKSSPFPHDGCCCPILVTDNDAEYLTDIVTEADRMGRGGEFADAYLK